MALEWDLHERYRSNGGRGPLTARILCVSDGVVRLERWRKEGARPTRFELTERFFLSDKCGWKLAAPQPSERDKETADG